MDDDVGFVLFVV